MNWKKALVVAPLSAALLFSTGGFASAASMDDGDPTVETAAVDLRADLGHLLSEHAFLAVEAMRNGAADSDDFDASVDALNSNTDDLSEAIASVYGDDAGKSFKKMWSAHIGYFVDYVNATADKDDDAKQEALDNLGNYKEDFSKFLETATDERLEAGSLAEGLQMHVNQLIGAFDNYVDGDYQDAYDHEREAIEHMHTVAKGLSSAIADQYPDKFDDTMAVTPAGDLRADLGYLLSEHAGLAVIAMQNGIEENPDFEASTDALNDNTKDLSKAIASVYGDEAGDKFQDMWSKHIGYFVDYVNATADKDEDAKQEALDHLSSYKEDFSEFMDTATEGNVEASDLAEGLQMHVDQLIGSFDSYVKGDYDDAFSQARDGYGHMYEAAKLLSSGIVAQYPDKFANDMPSEMPNTGLGMPQDQDNHMMWAWILGGAIFILAAFVAIRKYNTAKNQ
ncbi:copper amine oxidase [Lentibacillus sp. N15]|uniref:copper amine oxidase n=1 Tax=Lentibacillus songyuanensis TaxID=3136161 RepID=UPI0031BB42FC